MRNRNEGKDIHLSKLPHSCVTEEQMQRWLTLSKDMKKMGLNWITAREEEIKHKLRWVADFGSLSWCNWCRRSELKETWHKTECTLWADLRRSCFIKDTGMGMKGSWKVLLGLKNRQFDCWGLKTGSVICASCLFPGWLWCYSSVRARGPVKVDDLWLNRGVLGSLWWECSSWQ